METQLILQRRPTVKVETKHKEIENYGLLESKLKLTNYI